VKEYEEYDESIRKDVDTILSHIKLVWCNNQEEPFKYILNWFAQILVAGKKQQTALFLKTKPGAGKGIIFEFLLNKVLG